MNSLKKYFPEELTFIQEYASFFKLILKVRDDFPANLWGENMKSVTEAYFASGFPLISDFPKKSPYSRNLIGSDTKTFWQSMISRWEPKAVSTIYGHPDFIFLLCFAGFIYYAFLQASLLEEF